MKQTLIKIATLIIVFALLCVLMAVNGIYNFSYQEAMATFYYTSSTTQMLFTPGGFAHICSLWLQQFSICPYAGVMITALLLTSVVWLTASIIKKLSSERWAMPMAMIPALALVFMCYNVNYNGSGTVGILLMLCVIRGMLCYARAKVLMLYSLCGVLVLYALAGPVAMLYALLTLLIGTIQYPRRFYYYLSGVALTLILGWLQLRMSAAGSLAQALTPVGYFTLRLKAPSLVYMPWGCMAAVVALACFVGALRKGRRPVARIVGICALAVSAVVAVAGNFTLVDNQNEIFKELTFYIGRGQWDRVIEKCSHLPMDNLVHQNCLNLALAEEGRLADELFSRPCIDIRNIYIEGEKTPYMQLLLSDIYYSMGHVALAQRNAFEANESLNNLSPRLIKRLAETNIIYGNYAVAEKYLYMLRHTLYYRDWAKRMRKLLYNDAAVAADPDLGAKRRCLFPDNRFSASRGLDDDLRHILRSNPDHLATMQYLGSLYLLSKDLPRFASVIDEFADTTATLPRYFGEGMMAAYAADPDSVSQRYNIPAATQQRFADFNKSPNTQRDTYWYFFTFRQ